MFPLRMNTKTYRLGQVGINDIYTNFSESAQDESENKVKKQKKNKGKLSFVVKVKTEVFLSLILDLQILVNRRVLPIWKISIFLLLTISVHLLMENMKLDKRLTFRTITRLKYARITRKTGTRLYEY